MGIDRVGILRFRVDFSQNKNPRYTGTNWGATRDFLFSIIQPVCYVVQDCRQGGGCSGAHTFLTDEAIERGH